MASADIFDANTLRECVCDTPFPGLNCSAHQRISTLSASAALELGSNGPPNSCVVGAIIDSQESGKKTFNERDFLAFILERVRQAALMERSSRKSPIWPIPLTALRNSLSAHSTSTILAKGPGKDALAARIHGLLPSVIDMIWKDLNYLKEKGLEQEMVRVGAIFFLESLSSHSQLKRYFLCDRSIDIVWICWLETRGGSALPMSRPIMIELVGKMTGSKSLLARISDRLVQATSLKHVASRVVQWLATDALINQELLAELHAINVLLSAVTVSDDNLPGNLQPFLDAGIHLHICNAVLRQFSSKQEDVTLNVIMLGGLALILCVDASGHKAPKLLFELAATPQFMQVLSKIILFFTKFDSLALKETDLHNAFDSWKQIVSFTEHVAGCRKEGCWLEGNPEFLDNMRQNVELIHQQTATEVCERSGDTELGPEVLVLWLDIVTFYGIHEETVLERHKLLKRCCNHGCAYKSERVQKEKRFCCSGCRTVFYCDKVCQKIDWKTHKRTCDPRNIATREGLASMYKDSPRPSKTPHKYSFLFG